MLKFTRLTDVKHPYFSQALKIYTESFPPNERQTTAVIEQRLKDQFYQWLVGHLQDQVVCIALLYPLRNTEFILLDYLGTDQDYRGQGIGTKMLEFILQGLVDSQKTLIIEVEHPDYGENQEERQRRVQFYQRVGAKILKDVRYILPPLSGEEPMEMLLMVLPEYPGGKIEGSLLKKVIQQMYKEVYNKNENDSLLNSFVHEIREWVELILKNQF